MNMMWLVGWYGLGLLGAAVSRAAFARMSRRILGHKEPITRGGLIVIMLGAWFGPLTFVVAAVWWGFELINGWGAAWLAKPAFPQRD